MFCRSEFFLNISSASLVWPSNESQLVRSINFDIRAIVVRKISKERKRQSDRACTPLPRIILADNCPKRRLLIHIRTRNVAHTFDRLSKFHIHPFGYFKSNGCDWSNIPNVQDVIGCHSACSSVLDHRNNGTLLPLYGQWRQKSQKFIISCKYECVWEKVWG